MIGIIGGGQLGRMLAMAAARLGLKTCIYNDETDAPAFQVTPLQVAAPYDDRNMLTGFAQICDVITFEFENMPARAASHFWQASRPVRPGPQALQTPRTGSRKNSLSNRWAWPPRRFSMSPAPMTRAGRLHRWAGRRF